MDRTRSRRRRVVRACKPVMSDRFSIPAVGAPSSISFPAVHRHALANGTRVWFIPHGGVPAVTASMVIDGGVAADPADRPGLASLVGALVTEGAGGRDAIAMADAVARIGGHIVVESGADVYFNSGRGSPGQVALRLSGFRDRRRRRSIDLLAFIRSSGHASPSDNGQRNLESTN